MAEEIQHNNDQPKTVVGFLIIMSIITIILGFWQLNNYLKAPFVVNFETSTQNLSEQLAKIKASTASQFTDTDHDGLTDYEELYIYKTSPYLEDSDSDGLTDGEEITAGTNPNCSQGQDCQLYTEVNYNVNAIFEEFSNTSEEELLALSIRQALLANGVSAKELDQIDDATLIQMYNEIIVEETGQNTNQQLSLPPGVSKEELSNYTLEQIKEVLIAGGVSEEELNKIPDDELMSAWQDILATL